jgi:hypothetical protein
MHYLAHTHMHILKYHSKVNNIEFSSSSDGSSKNLIKYTRIDLKLMEKNYSSWNENVFMKLSLFTSSASVSILITLVGCSFKPLKRWNGGQNLKWKEK